MSLWPNKDFLDKKSKFGVDVLPLEALLDYNEDDTKESHFEVSVFAELFKEMLQTRFARGMLRALAMLDHEASKVFPVNTMEEGENTMEEGENTMEEGKKWDGGGGAGGGRWTHTNVK